MSYPINTNLPPFTLNDFIGTSHTMVKPSNGEGIPVYKAEVTAEEMLSNIIKANSWPEATKIEGSETIDQVCYKNDEKKMLIKFKSGGIYEYDSVSNPLYVRFMAAESKGKFFAQYIKTNKKIKAKRIK